MQAILTRFEQTPKHTIGCLVAKDLHVFTMENPWLDNQLNISCIPEGNYPVEIYNSPKYKEVYLLQETYTRSYIEFHVGNTVKNTKGCILPGLTVGRLNNFKAVLSSRKALKKMRSVLGYRFNLEIRNAS